MFDRTLLFSFLLLLDTYQKEPERESRGRERRKERVSQWIVINEPDPIIDSCFSKEKALEEYFSYERERERVSEGIVALHGEGKKVMDVSMKRNGMNE